MPFEPLRTDEQLKEPVKPGADMDQAMLAGCTGFVVASFASYCLVVWPFFSFQSAEHLRVLLLCCSVGMIPALVLASAASRRAGMAGACGAVAGAMATSVFLYLRLQQVFLAARARQAPEANYPESFVWLIPTVWILLNVLAAVVFAPRPREERDGKELQ